MRIVFFGTPEFAVPTLRALLDGGHTVLAVVSQPDRPKGRNLQPSPSPVKQAALALGLPVLTPDSFRKSQGGDAVYEQLRALEAEVWVVAAFGHILPQRFLDLPRLGCLNVHASLLPKYRGASPINAAILAGDEATGVSIMRLVREMDAGPVYLQWAVPIRPTDTAVTLEPVLAELGARALLEALRQIAEEGLTPTEQDHVAATSCHLLRKEDGLLDWRRTADELDRQIRGLAPWPGTYSFLGGRRVAVHKAVPFTHPMQKRAWPGQIFGAIGGRGMLVRAGDRGLLLELVKPEGKREMRGDELYQGLPKDQRDQMEFTLTPDGEPFSHPTDEHDHAHD